MSNNRIAQFVGFTGFLLIILSIYTHSYGVLFLAGAVLLIAALASGRVTLFG